MNNLEERILDQGFTKLAAPSSLSRAGRATKAVAKGVARGARRAARQASTHASEIADASAGAGTDGVVRMIEGEAANRGIEAGGQALTNVGTSTGSLGSMGVNSAMRNVRSGPSVRNSINARMALKGTPKSIASNAPASIGSRVNSINAMRAARKANQAARATRAAVKPTAQILRNRAQAAGLNQASNFMKQVQKSNTGGKVLARALGQGTLKALPLLGVGVDVALDGPEAALRENFQLTAPEGRSALESAARAGGDALTALSGIANPFAAPVAIPAAARTAHRLGRAAHAGSKVRAKEIHSAAARGDQQAVNRMVSSDPRFATFM